MSDQPCHAKPTGSDCYLASLQTDTIDFAFLTAARFFCVSFSNGDHCAWVTAILGAESFFPGPNSSEKMRKALAVVHEMRSSRKSVFRFSNPRCTGCSAIITQDERYLLQMVQQARFGQMSKANSFAMMLCEGNATDRVLAAVTGFADIVRHEHVLELAT